MGRGGDRPRPGRAARRPDRLQQVISNLPRTPSSSRPAAPHRRSPGTGWFARRHRSERHGPGRRPDLLPHVFERFRRARARPPDGGLGLGLTIVRIWSRRMAARWRSRVPRARRGRRHRPLAAAPGRRRRPRRSSGTFVAAGRSAPRRRPSRLIVGRRREHLECSARSSSITGRASPPRRRRPRRSGVEASDPTFLVSDIAMPDEDGYQLIARVRELDRERAARSRHRADRVRADDDRVRALVAGYDVHLSKPSTRRKSWHSSPSSRGRPRAA